jgi:hypothetical protein
MSRTDPVDVMLSMRLTDHPGSSGQQAFDAF